MNIIECVPNFSEGRDKKKLAAIARAIKAVSGVRLADYSGDVDHNRSVFTFLGHPDDVLQAALNASKKALGVIDMREQSGVHPRLGAIDVVPFVPLGRTKMKVAVDVAHDFGRQLYERFAVPVYFYGFAARKDQYVDLPDVRRGGYERLADKIKGPDGAPDLGENTFNARYGATAVGARDLLVAYNVNLNSDNLLLARHIASRIREKNGGLKHVRAIGVMLKSRAIAQVSFNLTNCRETCLKTVFHEVQTMAAEAGVDILESELIGLAPKSAFAGTTSEYLRLKDFDDHRLLETHIKALSK